MLARTPAISLAPVRQLPPRMRKLRRERRIAIRDALAEMMRTAEPTAFALEAPGRYALRVILICGGWTWGQADTEAALLVMAALQYVGAKRPTWKQGQPEYTQDGHAPRTRERCARCAKPLPEGNYRWCSDVCFHAALYDRRRRRDMDEINAKERIYRAAWSERQPPRECKACGRTFRPKRNNAQVYCSVACRDDGHRSQLKAPDQIRATDGRDVSMVCEGL